MDETRTIALGGGGEAFRVRAAMLTTDGVSMPEQSWPLDRRRLLAGSSPDADVVLGGVPGVSRRHFEIVADVSGYRIRDLDSKNGTWVDGLRVVEAWLPPGAWIQAGNARLRFDTGDQEVEIRLSKRDRFGRLIGTSPAMREVFALLERVAPSEATVLVTGPSGTGKELVADALHTESPRREGPFVVFDCSAVARELIESELFGHVRGAFTGAVASRAGALEQAHGGTLFLDEIGELDLDLQPRLLRVLERRVVRRVGSNETVPVEVRIVAATHRDLRTLIEEGRFREDLYYRLAVVQVRLPALHERPEDIPLLVESFLRDACTRRGIAPVELSWSTMQQLLSQPWRGNVRELRNFAERVVALASSDGQIDPRFLALDTASATSALRPPEVGPGLTLDEADFHRPYKDAKADRLDEFERAYWTRMLAEHGGNITRAAEAGGLHRKSLEYLLRKHGMDRGVD